MGVLFIINAKSFANNIRIYYYKYFKGEMFLMQLTLILTSFAYLFRSSYLLIGFVFYEGGILEIEKNIFEMKDKLVMLGFILTVVFLTEMLPILSLILTNAFILKNKSMRTRIIGGPNKNLLVRQEDDSDLEENSGSISERIRSIRSVIIAEFIDKDEENSQYHYHMKDKNAGREIFWTYHFFEYIDDYIENNSQATAEAPDNDKDEEEEQRSLAASNGGKYIQKRASSRKRKDIMRQLGKEEEIK